MQGMIAVLSGIGSGKAIANLKHASRIEQIVQVLQRGWHRNR